MLAGRDSELFLSKFRETKLGMLLGHAFSGNARTTCLVAVKPNLSAETLHTLQFAQICRSVCLKAVPNLVQQRTRDQLLDKIFGDIRNLQLTLQRGGSGGRVTGTHMLVYNLLADDILAFNEQALCNEARFASPAKTSEKLQLAAEQRRRGNSELAEQ